jgi:hypothetical protein
MSNANWNALTLGSECRMLMWLSSIVVMRDACFELLRRRPEYFPGTDQLGDSVSALLDLLVKYTFEFRSDPVALPLVSYRTEITNLLQGKAEIFGSLDELEPVDVLDSKTSVAVCRPRNLGEESDRLIIADGLRRNTCSAGDLSNSQTFPHDSPSIIFIETR